MSLFQSRGASGPRRCLRARSAAPASGGVRPMEPNRTEQHMELSMAVKYAGKKVKKAAKRAACAPVEEQAAHLTVVRQATATLLENVQQLETWLEEHGTASPSQATTVVRVCTGKACMRRGPEGLCGAVQATLAADHNVTVLESKCLDQCKYAPNVQISNSAGVDVVSVKADSLEGSLALLKENLPDSADVQAADSVGDGVQSTECAGEAVAASL